MTPSKYDVLKRQQSCTAGRDTIEETAERGGGGGGRCCIAVKYVDGERVTQSDFQLSNRSCHAIFIR
jgi:hypothetical protein